MVHQNLVALCRSDSRNILQQLEPGPKEGLCQQAVGYRCSSSRMLKVSMQSSVILSFVPVLTTDPLSDFNGLTTGCVLARKMHIYFLSTASS